MLIPEESKAQGFDQWTVFFVALDFLFQTLALCLDWLGMWIFQHCFQLPKALLEICIDFMESGKGVGLQLLVNLSPIALNLPKHLVGEQLPQPLVDGSVVGQLEVELSLFLVGLPR